MKYYASLVIPGKSFAPPNPCVKYLSLFHSKSSTWRFGGGKIEEGELPLACAVREAFEEFGITVTAAHFIDEVTHSADGDVWTGYWFAVDAYTGVPKLKEPTKHSELRWLSLTDLKECESHPEYEVALKHYTEGK